MVGEVEANFIPGSRRPVAVVIIARDWQTGQFESWVVCQVRPSYVRTAEDLSRMGLRTASWVFPFGGYHRGARSGLWVRLASFDSAEPTHRGAHVHLLADCAGPAAIELYGVMSYNIARRKSEMGIRFGAGCAGGAARWMVLRERCCCLRSAFLWGFLFLCV